MIVFTDIVFAFANFVVNFNNFIVFLGICIICFYADLFFIFDLAHQVLKTSRDSYSPIKLCHQAVEEYCHLSLVSLLKSLFDCNEHSYEKLM